MIDELHPGVVTANDVIRFSNFTLLRLLAPSNRDLLKLNEDSTINAGDLEDLRAAAADGEITESEADAFISLATTVGLVDTNLDVGSAIKALELFGLVASIAGVVLITGGTGAGTFLLAAGAAAEGGVAVVKLSQGDFAGAAFSTVFLVFDTAELAKAGQVILTRSRKALDALRNVDSAIDSVGLVGDADRLVEAARLRAGDVAVSDVGELAVIEASTREQIFSEMAALTTPARADAYTDAYFLSLRETLDDPSGYDDVLAAINSDPAGADAFVRWGDDVFDNSGALIDDFAEAVRGCPVELVGNNSFAGGTYVVLADGSRKRIDAIRVGDLVAGWDSSGVVVSGRVAATWPHSDDLYQARLGDGSTLWVTEDHRFYDAVGQRWIEVADFGRGQQFLTHDGDRVVLGEFDLGSVVTAPAFDLTVSDTHNYFVAADLTGHAVLAHNQGGPCAKFNIPAELVADLSSVNYTRLVDIGNTFVNLTRVVDDEVVFDGKALADELVAFIKNADEVELSRLLDHPRWVEEAGRGGPDRMRTMLEAASDKPQLFSVSLDQVSGAVLRSDFETLLDRHGTDFVAARLLWPAIELLSINRPLREVLGESLQRPPGKPWVNLDARHDNEFVQKLDDFGGSVDQPNPPRGGEGVLFFGSNPDLALKRWWANQRHRFDRSVQRLTDVRAAVGQSPALSARIEVVQIHEIGALTESGGGWIIRDFDGSSRELKDVVSGTGPEASAAQSALDEVASLLADPTDPALLDLRSKLPAFTETGRANANLHWSERLQKILVIDMQ